jgi:4-amino-4-deoxy-L-arabinose transferase-like glycosyltransferase
MDSGQQNTAPPFDSLTRWVLLGLLAIFLIVNLLSILTVPGPWCDEPFLSSISTNFIRHGTFGVTGVGSLSGLDQTNAGAPRLYHIGQGILIAILGNTLWVVRLYSVIAWGLSVWLIYLTGRKLYDARTGLLASVIFASSLNSYMASHTGRQEMWLIAGVLGFTYCYFAARSNPSIKLFFLLGLLMGFSLGLHTNGVWFGLAVAVLVIVDHYRSRRGWQYIAAAGAGGLISTLAMVLMQILPDPKLAYDQYTGVLNELNGLWEGSVKGRVYSEIEFIKQSYFTGLGRAPAALSLYGLLSFLLLLVRRNETDRRLLWITGFSHFLFALAMSHKNPRYAALWDGYVAIAVATAAVTIGTVISQNKRGIKALNYAPVLLIVPLLLLNLAGQSWLAYKFRLRDYTSYRTALLAHIPPGSSVFGDYNLLYMFDGRNEFLSDTYIAYYLLAEEQDYISLTQQDFAQILGNLDLDYVVYRGALVCNAGTDSVTRYYHNYLKSTCREVAQVEDRWFGTDGPLGTREPTIIYQCSTVR